MRHMQTIEKIFRGIALVGQIGFNIITPPLVLAWLAHRLITRHGGGIWVMVAAIVIGLIAAFCGVYQTVKPLLGKRDSDPPAGTSFRDHI